MNKDILNTIIYGDCLEEMKKIEDKSIDMILCDLPYGTTDCSWDSIIPFELLWKDYNRIIKDVGVICLFSSQPFTTKLIYSNIKLFKYCWYYKKPKGANWVLSGFQPLKVIEEICIFSKFSSTYNKNGKNMNYFPQKNKNFSSSKRGAPHNQISIKPRFKDNENYKKETTRGLNPINLLIDYTDKDKRCHPTQKPISLCEYLIKTYTNEGDTVLDNCIGSGTTAIACINTNRNFIGIEKEEKYVKISNDRIDEVRKEMKKKEKLTSLFE